MVAVNSSRWQVWLRDAFIYLVTLDQFITKQKLRSPSEQRMVTVGVKRMLPEAFAKMLSCFGCHRCCRFVVKRFVVMMMMMTTTVSEILVKIMMAMIMVVILIAKSMWLPRLWLMRRTLKVSISNMPLPSV